MLELKSVFFDGQMEEAECRRALEEMVRFAGESLSGKLHKLRYEYLNPRQDFLLEALKESGFRETAVFPGELKNGMDLVLYDKMIS